MTKDEELSNKLADAVEARVRDAAEHTAVSGGAVARPVNEHRASDDQIAMHRAPIAAVKTFVAAVAHHEILVFGNRERFAGRAEFKIAVV